MSSDHRTRSAAKGLPRGLAVLLFLVVAMAVQLGCTVPTESSVPNPSSFGQPVTFTASVNGFSGPGTGIVDFLDTGSVLAAGVPLGSNGLANFTTSSLAIGSHTMTVHYYGDSNYAAGDSAPIMQVVKAGAASTFFTLTPCRLVDTRAPNGALGGPSLVAGQARTFALAGTCSVPPGVTALSVNVTVTGATAPGYVSVFAAGTPAPPVSTVNFRTGQTRANNAIVAMNAGSVTVVLGQATGNAHVIIDANGYMQ
jgi:hypothetical protein